MKIFVAGATGTLGMPLVRELVNLGHHVTGLTRTEAKGPLLEKLGAEAAIADALDEAAINRAVHKARPDHVVHLLTAIPKGGPFRIAAMEATNKLRVAGTANLLRASIAVNAKRIVGESMIFAYGYGDHGAKKKVEADRLQPREPYRWMQGTVDALRSLENQMTEANRKGLIEAIGLRFGLLYGPGVPSTESTVESLRKGRQLTVSRGDGDKSWIHVADAVSAIIDALERGRAGEIYNIVDDEPVSYSAFRLFAARAFGAPHPRSIPYWFLRMTAPYAALSLSTRLAVSNEKAKRELGWSLQYPNYETGLRDLANFSRQKQKRAA